MWKARASPGEMKSGPGSTSVGESESPHWGRNACPSLNSLGDLGVIPSPPGAQTYRLV